MDIGCFLNPVPQHCKCSEAEMFDFHARFYDPQLGRWLLPDPAEQFSNPYVGIANNPIRYIDPDGTYVPMRFWRGYNEEGMSGGGLNSDRFGGGYGRNTSIVPSSTSWVNSIRSTELNLMFLSTRGFSEYYNVDITTREGRAAAAKAISREQGGEFRPRDQSTNSEDESNKDDFEWTNDGHVFHKLRW